MGIGSIYDGVDNLSSDVTLDDLEHPVFGEGFFSEDPIHRKIVACREGRVNEGDLGPFISKTEAN